MNLLMNYFILANLIIIIAQTPLHAAARLQDLRTKPSTKKQDSHEESPSTPEDSHNNALYSDNEDSNDASRGESYQNSSDECDREYYKYLRDQRAAQKPSTKKQDSHNEAPLTLKEVLPHFKEFRSDSEDSSDEESCFFPSDEENDQTPFFGSDDPKYLELMAEINASMQWRNHLRTKFGWHSQYSRSDDTHIHQKMLPENLRERANDHLKSGQLREFYALRECLKRVYPDQTSGLYSEPELVEMVIANPNRMFDDEQTTFPLYESLRQWAIDHVDEYPQTFCAIRAYTRLLHPMQTLDLFSGTNKGGGLYTEEEITQAVYAPQKRYKKLATKKAAGQISAAAQPAPVATPQSIIKTAASATKKRAQGIFAVTQPVVTPAATKPRRSVATGLTPAAPKQQPGSRLKAPSQPKKTALLNKK